MTEKDTNTYFCMDGGKATSQGQSSDTKVPELRRCKITVHIMLKNDIGKLKAGLTTYPDCSFTINPLPDEGGFAYDH